MKIALLGTLLIITVIVIVGGLVFFRSTSPAADIVDTNLILEEEKIPSGGNNVNSNQFLMAEPETALPPASQPELSDETNDTPESDQISATEKITIDDFGFTPAAITIKAGTTITFVNNGQAIHWPASAIHPAHTLLPGFDAKPGLQTGDEYSFTFNRTGTWAYHDHLSPAVTGTIIVE